MRDPLLPPRPEGLYCPAGDFFIDPMLPVARAVVSHAHGDHARSGSGHNDASLAGIGLMQERLGSDSLITGQDYGSTFRLGNVDVSLHPSGHVLGAAQMRMEHESQVVVVSGDYQFEMASRNPLAQRGRPGGDER